MNTKETSIKNVHQTTGCVPAVIGDNNAHAKKANWAIAEYMITFVSAINNFGLQGKYLARSAYKTLLSTSALP